MERQKRSAIVLSKTVWFVSIRYIMGDYCEQPSMACHTGLPHPDTPRRRN